MACGWSSWNSSCRNPILWANVVKGVSTKVASGEREAHTTAKIQEQHAAGAKSVLLQKNAVAGSSAGTARLHAAQTIECRLNGAVHNLSAVGMVAGQKREMLMVVRGQELRYRFDFLSAHGQVYVEGDGDGPGWPFYSRGSETEFHYSGRAHVGLQPFITSSEVSLIRDHRPALSADSKVKTGTLRARVTDASDESVLGKNKNVSNGYHPGAWKLHTDPTISLFRGSQLFAGPGPRRILASNTYSINAWNSNLKAVQASDEEPQYTATMPGGSFVGSVPVGDYSCMIRHQRFYTAFLIDCHVTEEGADLGDIPLDPILNPGDREDERRWNASPNVLNEKWGDRFAR